MEGVCDSWQPPHNLSDFHIFSKIFMVIFFKINQPNWFRMSQYALQGLALCLLRPVAYHPETNESHIRGIFLKNLFLNLAHFPYSVVEYTTFVGFISIFSYSILLGYQVVTDLLHKQCSFYGVLNYLSTRQYTQICEY